MSTVAGAWEYVMQALRKSSCIAVYRYDNLVIYRNHGDHCSHSKPVPDMFRLVGIYTHKVTRLGLAEDLAAWDS